MNILNRLYILLLVDLLFVHHKSATASSALASITKVYIVYLGEKHHRDPKLVTDSHHNLLASVIGSKGEASELMIYSYKHGFSGFAAKLTESQAQQLVEHPEVVRVMPNSLHTLQTTRSWDYLGLSPQNNPNNLLNKSNMGDGVIIGVLDTGIWPESEAFNDGGLGLVPSRWKGGCDSGQQFNSTINCNRKLIGARWFVDGLLAEYGKSLNISAIQEFLSPRDANGHGTHVSSTACGSFVANVSYKGSLGQGTARGGAPMARLAVYKVCWDILGGQCASADILKGFDEAIHDGVDVISASIGSSVPLASEVDERNAIAIGSFHAVARGIVAVCGAGNDGPASQTVTNTAPWILTVAASTMDRLFPTSITLGNNMTLLGQALYIGKEIGFAGLLYPGESAGSCLALSLNQSVVDGKVVLCFTSSTRRAAISIASLAVRAAGGVGVIVAKNPSDVLGPCDKDFPCIEVDFEIGTIILNYIRSTRNPMVKLSQSKTLFGKLVSANVAHFSSRGPNSIEPSIHKPDIAAPGVNILAATSPLSPLSDTTGFAMISGTSMATPHVSGIVALLRALHPKWSPAAIKSAIVTTGSKTETNNRIPISAQSSPRKVADPFDYGGGIINPNLAADPGLVYDMETSDYANYLCARGYSRFDISKLTGQSVDELCNSSDGETVLDVNLPFITVPHLVNCSTLSRTVTNVGPECSVYVAIVEHPIGARVYVEPTILKFDSRIKKASLVVTVCSTHRFRLNSGYEFGSLKWFDGEHVVTSPISVRTSPVELSL